MERLDPARFRAVVFSERPVLAGAVAARGTPVERLDEDWGFWSARPEPPEFRRGVLAHGAALLHVNAPSLVPVCVPAARALRMPVVAHLHLPVDLERVPAPFASAFCAALSQADAVVGVSGRVVAPLRAPLEAAGLAPGRLRVVYNGVDTVRLARGSAVHLRAELDIPADAFVAVAVGALDPIKGHDVTLRALAAVRDCSVDLRLLVCGEGDEAARLRALAEELGVAPHVHFLGYRSDVGAILRDVADFAVSSARDEALGLNVLEAQALGTPVVASRIPAHEEAIHDGVSGVLVTPADPAALADALVALAGAPGRRAALGGAGPRFAERFAMTRYVAAFEALYDEVLAAPCR